MSESEHQLHLRLRRREALLAIGGAGLGVLAAGPRLAGPAAAASSAGATAAARACVLTPEVTAGPYYIVNHLSRRNITDGQAGTPLQLRLTVQDASTCDPLAGANVEVWHANAGGKYSGYD